MSEPMSTDILAAAEREWRDYNGPDLPGEERSKMDFMAGWAARGRHLSEAIPAKSRSRPESSQ